jgi:hypothetical protein
LPRSARNDGEKIFSTSCEGLTTSCPILMADVKAVIDIKINKLHSRKNVLR